VHSETEKFVVTLLVMRSFSVLLGASRVYLYFRDSTVVSGFKYYAKKKRPHRAAFFNFTRLFLGVLFAEAFDPTCGIDQLLLTGVKRMARRTNFCMNLPAESRTGLKSVPAITANGAYFILGMDTFFHLLFSLATWLLYRSIVFASNKPAK